MQKKEEYETIIETRDATLIIQIIGELNIGRTQHLLDKIDKDIESFENVIIDLTKVEYINSTAVGALLGYHRKAEHNIKLIVTPGSHIHLLFINLSIQNVFKIFDSVEKALNGW